MSVIGKRNLNLFIGADVTLYNPADNTEQTVYWSNRSWITNPNDSVAANRQYVGLIAQAFDLDYSWFSGDTLGGRSTRSYGALRAINPLSGVHSLNYIFEDGLKVQGRTITYRIGRIGDDLGSMITFTLTGRNIRQSEDGFEVVIDLSDDSQALDTSIFRDKFQGLGAAVRHEAGETSTIADNAALNPATAWYFDVAYRLPSWAVLASGLTVVKRAASGGGNVYALILNSDNSISVQSRTSANATVTFTPTDLEWVADGRWHRLAGKWTGTALEAWHSTRTAGTKSADTTAQTTIKAGTGALSIGDCGSTLDASIFEYADVAELRFAVDADVPTDAEILDRMKRPLNADEAAECEWYPQIDENEGSYSFDQSVTNVAATGTLTAVTIGNGDTVTIDAKVYTFQNTLTDVDGHVKVGATDSDSIDNLIAGINLAAGSGTLYAASTTLHPTVFAAAGAGDTMTATAKVNGDIGNFIATTEALTDGSWAHATLTGGVGHTLTLGAGVSWVQSFEGTTDLAGTAKPLAFGRTFNAPITWADRANGAGVVHARCFKGLVAAYEGADPLVIGWPRTLFQDVSFEAAGDTISFSTRSAGGADRLDAQPGFSGLKAGQQIVVEGTSSNDGTYTLTADATERVLVVSPGLTDEAFADAFITANGASGDDPDLWLWFDAGGVLFPSDGIPSLPATFELLGDIGAEVPTPDTDVHFPEYAPAIMRRIMQDWAGFAAADLSDTWDNGEDTPDNTAGAYYDPAGVWLDPARDRTIRSVLDDGATTVWARWGQRLADDTWDLIPIEAPSGTADIDLGALEILGLKRIRSVPPVGGLILRSTLNYAPLREGEVAGTTQDSDAGKAAAAALRREYLEGSAVIDATVARAYPFAETPEPIETWLRYQADAQPEAQRRYDILKVEREMYDAEASLYGIDQNPLDALLTLTDEDFGTLVSGKDFWLVHLQANDEAMTLTGWG